MKILFCQECHKYTLQRRCHQCNRDCIPARPAKFSPEDRTGKWRRIYKQSLTKPNTTYL